MQTLEEQDEQIGQLETAAQEMQDQLAAANKTAGQYANTMQKV